PGSLALLATVVVRVHPRLLELSSRMVSTSAKQCPQKWSLTNLECHDGQFIASEVLRPVISACSFAQLHGGHGRRHAALGTNRVRGCERKCDEDSRDTAARGSRDS